MAADVTAAGPEAVVAGMRTTFALAALLVLVAMVIALGRRDKARSPAISDPDPICGSPGAK